VAVILWLSRDIVDPVEPDPTRPFDTLGAVLSAVGLILVVMGVLAADNDLALMAVLLAVGAAFIAVFFLHIRSANADTKSPCCPPDCSATERRTSGWSPRTRNGYY
jgi:hypothetical protein